MECVRREKLAAKSETARCATAISVRRRRDCQRRQQKVSLFLPGFAFLSMLRKGLRSSLSISLFLSPSLCLSISIYLSHSLFFISLHIFEELRMLECIVEFRNRARIANYFLLVLLLFNIWFVFDYYRISNVSIVMLLLNINRF